MGCFSWLCHKCGEPINSDCISKGDACVLYLLEGGKVLERMEGHYNGYGRVFYGEGESLDWNMKWSDIVSLIPYGDPEVKKFFFQNSITTMEITLCESLATMYILGIITADEKEEIEQEYAAFEKKLKKFERRFSKLKGNGIAAFHGKCRPKRAPRTVSESDEGQGSGKVKHTYPIESKHVVLGG